MEDLVQVPPVSDARSERRRGMRLAAKLHLLQIPIGVAFGIFMALKTGDWSQFLGAFWQPASCIGITQLLYLVPAAVIELAKGRKARAKGVALCALITFLLNIAIAFLLIFYLCSRIGR